MQKFLRLHVICHITDGRARRTREARPVYERSNNLFDVVAGLEVSSFSSRRASDAWRLNPFAQLPRPPQLTPFSHVHELPAIYVTESRPHEARRLTLWKSICQVAKARTGNRITYLINATYVSHTSPLVRKFVRKKKNPIRALVQFSEDSI